MATIKSECSGCSNPFTLNTVTGKVTAKVPSNGKRGSLHVPARTETTEAVDDGILLLWDCPFPGCGYAESAYNDEHAEMRD